MNTPYLLTILGKIPSLIKIIYLWVTEQETGERKKEKEFCCFHVKETTPPIAILSSFSNSQSPNLLAGPYHLGKTAPHPLIQRIESHD